MIKEFLSKNQFEPGITGIFTNPFYIARKNLLKHIKELGKEVKGKTLDVGCGTKPYEKYFNSTGHIGIEVGHTIHKGYDRADVYYNGDILPFQDKEFDSIVTNQVLEHVFTPDLFLSEINRVLKSNGTLLLTVPFAWDEHEQPFDYARYSSFGLSHLLDKHGFEIIRSRKSAANITAVFQLFNAYLYKKTRKIRAVKIFFTFFIMSLITITGLLLNIVFPGNEDFYLDNIITAKKTRDI